MGARRRWRPEGIQQGQDFMEASLKGSNKRCRIFRQRLIMVRSPKYGIQGWVLAKTQLWASVFSFFKNGLS